MSSRKQKKARKIPGLSGVSAVESCSDYVVLTPARRNGTRPWQGRQQAHIVPHSGSDITIKNTALGLAGQISKGKGESAAARF